MPVGGTEPPHGYHGRRNGLHTPGRSSRPPRVRIEAVSVRHRALNSGVHQDVHQDVHQGVRQGVPQGVFFMPGHGPCLILLN